MPRRFLPFLLLAVPLAGCGPDYSPNTYASTAVQQAAKVDQGVVVGVRPVGVSPQGSTGAVAGAAAGAAVGSQVPTGGNVSATLGAIGGSLIGGLVGSGAEKAVGETRAWEYIVRKPSGELISVTQKDEVALAVGTKVLVIAGSQARIVPDYIVPQEVPTADAPKAEVPKGEAPKGEAPKGEAGVPAAAAPQGNTQEPEPTPKPAATSQE